MDRLYRGNAEDAKRIRAIILFDDVMITVLIKGKKANENELEPREADSV
jgi:hypothetical protein